MAKYVTHHDAKAYLGDTDDASTTAAKSDGAWNKTCGIKLFIDGSIQLRTACTRCGYHDQPHNHGYLSRTPEQQKETFVAYHNRGYQIAMHANGDGAIDVALDLIEQVTSEFPRVRSHVPLDRMLCALAHSHSLAAAAPPPNRALPTGESRPTRPHQAHRSVAQLLHQSWYTACVCGLCWLSGVGSSFGVCEPSVLLG